jgi:uncharacterized membrane protein (UPF0182 family)
MMQRRWGIVAGIVALFFLLPFLLTYYTEWLWFVNVGYEGVFWTTIYYVFATGIASFILAYLILAGIYTWTRRIIENETNKTAPYGYAVITAIAFFLAVFMTGTWPIVLRFVNRVLFGTVDPFFGMDVAFYTFALPFYNAVIWYILITVGIGAVGSILLYAARFGAEEYDVIQPVTGEEIKGSDFNFARFLSKVNEHAFTQVHVLGGIILTCIAGLTWLARYELLFNQQGTVFGIGYTQSLITVPVLTFTAGVAAVAALACFANTVMRQRRVLTISVALLVLLTIVGNVAGSVTQSLVVEPDEFNKERPYLEHEINYTNTAFDLERIQESTFDVSPNLTRAQLESHETTMENIRLWDWRPLLKTYRELQIFRTYYEFLDVDIDRYAMDGMRQVMLAPRELDLDGLPTETWINQHLVYTHGHGLTMSPVSGVSSEGLPEFTVQDIPPRSDYFNITQPGIYYGENTNTYSIVNTSTREFDYPSGDQNVYTTYSGNGGVDLDDILDRFAFAVRFGASQIFFSQSIDDGSKIQFHKNIRDRVQTIAPFLSYDDDPYMVIHEGELYWILDAYTTTSAYPYSNPVRFKDDRVNYVRNSVKVVISAYDGDVDFYIADDEPIVQTYGNAYDNLFKPLSELPNGLEDNLRYPEDIFSVQSDVYATYHMRDPQVFYNKEDVWRVPNEILRGQQVPMEPYYMIMRLPGSDEAEFVQVLPFVPRGKENMIGWMAARSDPPNYGDLFAYQLSKQELVYGPMQIESRISQDTEISQRITLWSQSGSSVFRGNLLAIPIDDTFLYVEPLYLQSTQEGSLPQLQRVIVAHGDKLTMQPTLDEALDVILGEQEERAPVATNVTQPTPEQSRILNDVRSLFEEAQAALRNGNFTAYAATMDELGQALEE